MQRRDFMEFMNNNIRIGAGTLVLSIGVETLVSSDSANGTKVPAPI